MNKAVLFCFINLIGLQFVFAQPNSTKTDTLTGISHDDPSQVLTRFELFNEFQKLQNGESLNVTTFRSVIAFAKRFTTRIDIPLAHYSGETADYDQFGLGDISFRLLGYKLIDSKNSALLASVEFSFNTAQSPLLGTGKNMIIPVVSYSKLFLKQQTIVALSAQQYYSMWGNETRPDISFSKLQFYYLKGWSKKVWTLVLPEMYLDHKTREVSMDIETKIFFRLSTNLALWGKGGIGIFGDHPARYAYTTEIGLRYLMTFGRKK